MESYRYIHAKSSWMTSIDYLSQAHSLAEIGATHGNIDKIMRAGIYSEYLEMQGDPGPEKSDFIAVVPMVYMITNCIEALIKGFNYASHPAVAPTSIPKFSELVSGFKEEFSQLEELQRFVRIYTEEDFMPELLASFIKHNEMSAEEFFNTRRYIKNSNFINLIERYKQFIYDAEQGRAFFQQVLEDIKRVFPAIEMYQDGLDSEGQPGPMILALRKD